MDLDFSPQELAFRDEVRTFLAAKLPAEVLDGAKMSTTVFVEPEVGQSWNAVLNEQGWLGYQWPTEVGGTGWTPTQRYIFEKECAIAGAPNLTGLALKLVAPVIWHFGTQSQKDYYLPRILSGEDYWCQGFSEPGSGSDLASLQCRAVRKGDKYIVNGSKMWTTHAHHANHIFCLVRTDTEVKRQAGISFLLLHMHQPGITVRPILTLAGDHEVNQVFFDNAEAPVENLIGEEGQGWTIAKFLLENERGGSCQAPKMLADLNKIIKAAKAETDGKGGLLTDDREWTRRVAKAQLNVEALEVIELRILADIAKGRQPGPQTSLTKLLASKARQEIDLLAVDLYGDAGLQLDMLRLVYSDNAPPPLHSLDAQLSSPRYLNSLAWTIFGGSSEVQANIIAKTVLGLG